jgi:hypothetical protein
MLVEALVPTGRPTARRADAHTACNALQESAGATSRTRRKSTPASTRRSSSQNFGRLLRTGSLPVGADSNLSVRQDHRSDLKQLSGSANRSEADRAGAILLSLGGWTSAEIGEAFGVREDTVRDWRSAFMREGLSGIERHAAPVQRHLQERMGSPWGRVGMVIYPPGFIEPCVLTATSFPSGPEIETGDQRIGVLTTLLHATALAFDGRISLRHLDPPLTPDLVEMLFSKFSRWPSFRL